MTVVSEGIETAEQVERLTHLGCDFAQGFYFGSATGATEAETLLTDLPYLAVMPPVMMPRQNYATSDFPILVQPVPGHAPMAPRRRRTARKMLKRPEELPSIYEVGRQPELSVRFEPEPKSAPVIVMTKPKKKTSRKSQGVQAKSRKKKR
jgi:hypothetical protein